jgi:hypothetical protein
MKLTEELKKRIDDYFDNISAEELIDLSINKYGFILVDEEDSVYDERHKILSKLPHEVED